MKKLLAILLMVVMIGLPFDTAFGRGGDRRGGGGPSRGASSDRAGKKSDKRGKDSKKSRADQAKRDKAEDKDSAKDCDRR